MHIYKYILSKGLNSLPYNSQILKIGVQGKGIDQKLVAWAMVPEDGEEGEDGKTPEDIYTLFTGETTNIPPQAYYDTYQMDNGIIVHVFADPILFA